MITKIDSNLDQELDKTGHSIRWILNTLEECCSEYVEAKSEATVVSIKTVDVSVDKGYYSRVFITTFYFDNGKECTLALKVPTFDMLDEWIKSRESAADENPETWKAHLQTSHNIECDALKLVLPFTNFPAPKAYYTQKRGVIYDNGLSDTEAPGIIIMSAIYGSSLGLFSTATKEQCISMAEDFAVFHDYIDQTEEEKWKNKFDSQLHMGVHLREAIVKAILKIGEIHPEAKKECQLLADMDFKSYSQYALKSRPAEFSATTLIHGDTWNNNIIFKKNPDGSLGNKVQAYIDFQTLFEGSPMFDIARFVSICSDADVRRDGTPAILQAYYKKLTELYKRRRKRVPFTLEMVSELYDLAFIHQAQNVALLAQFFSERKVENKTVMEAEEAKMNLRAKFALIDAVKALRKLKLSEKFNSN
ncbi:unnamed protein product [Bursaphelenchus xylophilus]|uniref:(pine wood nematode) hypothetical protein n=1 Tax=Bursaphelenchus xylophilus TaxID=6326 RepID=A0A1I7RM24_BURXY|nr:unnamed protein product [Bursaphelenchus xylophilus]CAG9118137.1 unnamed protein product [Bursaphelenchus xylophilus]